MYFTNVVLCFCKKTKKMGLQLSLTLRAGGKGRGARRTKQNRKPEAALSNIDASKIGLKERVLSENRGDFTGLHTTWD